MEVVDRAGGGRPLRVLIAHRYFWPENLALFPMLLKEIGEWHRRQGHETTVLSAAANDSADGERRRAWGAANGVTLRETHLPIDRGRRFLARIGTSLRYGAALAKQLLGGRYDIVLVGSYPPVVSAAVARLCRPFKGFDYVYYVQDIFPESIAGSRSRVVRFGARLLRSIDARNMRSAAAVITISEDMGRTLLRRGTDGARIHAIPNCALDEPIEVTSQKRESTPLLIYAGNHGPMQNLFYLLRVIQRAQASRRFRVAFLGEGRDLAALRQMATRERIRGVEFCGSVPRDEAQVRIGAADGGLIPALPGLYEVAFPSKMMSYLSAGVPVLAFAEKEASVGRFLAAHAFGEIADPSEIESAANSLCRFVESIEAGKYERRAIADRAAEIFSRDRFFRAYERVVGEIALARIRGEERGAVPIHHSSRAA